jgi:hypothetical protein
MSTDPSAFPSDSPSPAVPAPPPPPAAAPAAVVRQTSTLAVVSLVSALCGWTVLPWLGSLVAVITGHMARAEIRRNPETMEGDGMAVAGLVMGWAMIGLSVLAVLVIVLFFGGLLAVIAGLGANGQLN